MRDAKVLVIGGSSGIDEAIATTCARLGSKVTIASCSTEKLEAAVSRIGVGVRHRTIDIRDDESVQAFFASDECFGHVVVSAAEVTIAPVRTVVPAVAKESMDSKF